MSTNTHRQSKNFVQKPSRTSATVTAAQVDAIFAQWNRMDSPGCALAVIRGGRIIYMHGYGIADLSHDVRITPATPFHVASVSKQFTAAAIVLLAQEGKLSLEDDVRNYLPELHKFDARITIRNLLQHTSGLRDQWDLLQLAGYRYSLDLITDDDVINLVVRQRALNFPPGTDYSYSNTGYTLLGQIIKRVTDESLRNFASKNIFEPLGMTNTHFRDDHAEINKGEALGYEPAKDGTFRLSVTNFDTVGATSLYTTVEDLARWDENFYTGIVGGADFTRRMTHTDPLLTGKINRYAMGLMIGAYRGLPIVEHGGGDAGYRSNFIRFPEQHLSVACLCNTVIDATALTRKVADLYLADYFLQPAPALLYDGESARLPSEFVSGKVGCYRARNLGVLMQLVAGDGHLVLLVGGEKKVLCVDGRGTSMLPGVRRALHFEPPDGQAQHLAIEEEESTNLEVWDRLPDFSLAAGAEKEFVGPYYSAELDATYSLEARQGKLVLKRPKCPADELVPVGRDLFGDPTISRWMAWTAMVAIRFERDVKGDVSGMMLTTSRSRNLKFVRRDARE